MYQVTSIRAGTLNETGSFTLTFTYVGKVDLVNSQPRRDRSGEKRETELTSTTSSNWTLRSHSCYTKPREDTVRHRSVASFFMLKQHSVNLKS